MLHLPVNETGWWSKHNDHNKTDTGIFSTTANLVLRASTTSNKSESLQKSGND